MAAGRNISDNLQKLSLPIGLKWSLRDLTINIDYLAATISGGYWKDERAYLVDRSDKQRYNVGLYLKRSCIKVYFKCSIEVFYRTIGRLDSREHLLS